MKLVRNTSLLLSALTVLALFVLTTCGKDSPTKTQAPDPPQPPPPAAPVATRIDITPSSVTISAIGDTVQLTARIFDQNSNIMSGAMVTWQSSDTQVATVSIGGLVSAAGNGSATITARLGNATATIAVTVSQSASSIVIEPASATLISLSEKVQLRATVKDGNGQPVSDASVTWKSSDTAVATVSAQGLVTAMGNGRIEIMARVGNVSASADISVRQIPRTLHIEPERAVLTVFGETLQLAATVQDGNGQPVADASVTWQSGNFEVAAVSDGGLVTAISNGTATITARSGDLSASSEIYVQGPDSDRVFLTALYNTLDGPNWINAANWNSKMPLGQWHGVSVNAEDRVTALNLASNGLSGAIPPEIGQLTSLEGIALDGNRLTGAIPPDIGLLSNLKHLYLFSNQLTGAIPSELGNLENLLHLCLDRNRFSGTVPEELGSLTNLKWLHLYENFDLSGPLPETFTGLELSELLLQNTQACAPTTERFEEWLNSIEDKKIATCGEQPQKNTDRVVLVAFYHATGGPGWVNNANWLSDKPLRNWDGVYTDENDRVVVLSFWENNLSGSIPPELGQLSNLTRLDISKNNLSGSIPAELGQLHKLEQLRLYRNKLLGSIPAELGQLQNLKEFDLDGNQLTGSIPAELGQLHKLEILELGSNPGQKSNQLTGSIPTELGKLGNLVHLGLRNNQLTGTIPAELGQLHNLEHLGLGSNELTGSIPSGLDKLQNLKDLSLDRNQLTGEIPSWVVQLYNLEELGLSDNLLSGEIPPELSLLTKLKWLRLDRNKLTGSIPPELGDLPGLQLLLLSENEALTGPIPAELTNLSNLGRFSMFSTQLCVPTDEVFDDWLSNIPRLGTIDRPEIIVRCEDRTSRDRDALTALYHTTGGPSWIDNTNWLSDEPLNQWYGVVTAESGLVESIDLVSNNLIGRLPRELGDLSELRHLKYDGNSGLSGPIPLDLSKLNLESLSLNGTALCIPLDEDFQAWFQQLSESSVATCVKPSTEREVLVDFYHATGGDHWTNNTNWLSDEPITEWYGVNTFGNGTVRGLSLRGNNLVGSLPKSLSQLQNAIFLYFTDNQLEGIIPAELSQMRYMRSLQFYNNKLVGIIPPDLGLLKSLEHLDFSRNQLTGSIPRELGQLASLTILRLDTNQLTGSIPSELGQLASLTNLRLDTNQLTGSIPSELGQLSNLTGLLIFDNELAGTIPPDLGHLKNLEHLDLSRNQLTGSIPRELGQLASLTNLHLGGNQLMGSILPEFGQLRNLADLWLENNQLTGAIPHELGQLSNLTHLNLSVNRLTGEIPKELVNLLHLKYLNVSSNLDICVPPNAEFQAWLGKITAATVVTCPGIVDLVKSSAYLTQSVQSLKYPVPLVADEPALLRVFLTSDGTVANKPAVKATFYHDGAEVHSAVIPSGGVRVPDQVDESSLSISSNVLIPGDVILPGLGFVVEIGRENDQLTRFGSMGRIPETGMIEVDVQDVPDFDLTMVPLLWSEVPDFSIVTETEGLTAESDLFRLTRDLLPVQDFHLTVREPVYVSSDPVFSSDHVELLGEVEAIRTMDGAGGYYMGVLRGGGGFGFASRPGVVSLATLDGFAIAHELGHNLSLGHAPCSKGLRAIGFLDPAFPYVEGNIGAWGFNLPTNALVYPSTSDLMSYCDPVWISDYHFDKMIEYRLTEEEELLLMAGSTSSKSLLLWGGFSEENGLYLEPAFIVDSPVSLPREGGPYRLEGYDASSNAMFELDFAMGEIADGDGGVFVFAIPVQQGWSGRLARITLTGPEGFMEITKNSGRSAAILLNPSTGRVRGILRDWPELGASTPSARRVLPESNLDVVISSGIPDVGDW